VTYHEISDEYRSALDKVRSAKKVFQVYSNAEHNDGISEFCEKARTRWEDALELLCDFQANLIKEQYETNTVNDSEIDSLRIQNEQLTQDKKRLLNQLRQSLGVESKTMKGSEERPSDSTSQNSGITPADPLKRSKKKRGAPKGHKGKTRFIPKHVDFEEIIPALTDCHCGGQIEGLDEYDQKYIEDIPPICKITTKKSYQIGRCLGCGVIHRNKDGYNGPPVVIGPNLSAHLTMMRQMGCTFRKLSFFCNETLGVELSPSGVLGIVCRASEKLRPAYDEIGSMLRTQEVVHGDETGWKIGRLNWYIWCFCNRQMAYFKSSQTRAATVPKAILGEDFPGTLICDFYAAYNFIPNLQRCLIHYLRDIQEERKIFPGSNALAEFEESIWTVIKKGLAIQALPTGKEKSNKAHLLETELNRAKKYMLPKGKPTTLQKRIGKYEGELLTFVENPEVEYHNNRAERQIRPMVISRKMSYGSDTALGAERTCILHSVVETCRLNSRKPVDFLRVLLEGSIAEGLFSPKVIQATLA